MFVCEYGCGQEAKYTFNSGKKCCSKSHNSCPVHRKNLSYKMKKIRKDQNSKFNTEEYKETRRNIMYNMWGDKTSKLNTDRDRIKKKQSESAKNKWKDKNGIFNSLEYRKKLSDSIKNAWADENNLGSDECRKKQSNFLKIERQNPNSNYNKIETIQKQIEKNTLTIEDFKKKFPTFTKIEELRYHPKTGEIQARCKNHNCENSKENNGWFTPSRYQLFMRKNALENEDGNDANHMYCSEKCKSECPLFNFKPRIKSNKEIELGYNTFRQTVLERENYICEYCGKKANSVHHEKPQKTHPHMKLDPDNGVVCCKECHTKYGHKDECSYGKLAYKICI